jgi:hypothetical protein
MKWSILQKRWTWCDMMALVRSRLQFESFLKKWDVIGVTNSVFWSGVLMARRTSFALNDTTTISFNLAN